MLCYRGSSGGQAAQAQAAEDRGREGLGEEGDAENGSDGSDTNEDDEAQGRWPGHAAGRSCAVLCRFRFPGSKAPPPPKLDGGHLSSLVSHRRSGNSRVCRLSAPKARTSLAGERLHLKLRLLCQVPSSLERIGRFAPQKIQQQFLALKEPPCSLEVETPQAGRGHPGPRKGASA